MDSTGSQREGKHSKKARPVRNSGKGQYPSDLKVSNGARIIATTVLNRFDPLRDYAGAVLDEFIGQTKEKQRASDLVFGTIRNRPAIDMIISGLSDCPVERMPAKLLNIIRIGAYELIYCPRTGEHAIVNEAVEIAKVSAGKKQFGFVNAVLRQIARHIKNRSIPLTGADAQRTLPQTISSGCQFDVTILPQPEKSPADYFCAAFSLPKWLVESWLAEFGIEKTRQICFASNRRPSIYIRPNTLKTTIQGLAEKFRQVNIDFEIAAERSMIKVNGPAAVAELPGFAEGLFSIQDITASQPVRIFKPHSDQIILDLCAAPGTKTTQLAELTNDEAKIIATDIDSRRLEKVRENTDRLGIKSVRIVPFEELRQRADQTDLFDAVLLDVPCSNTGVLAKRPEARFRISPEAIAELTEIQNRLLETAAGLIKPSGKICYSTCSIQNAENSGLVKKFLWGKNNLKFESEFLTLPSAEGFDCDGGYAAVITGK